MKPIDTKLDDIREAILRGELSRRDVLRRSLAIGLSAPVIAALLAACGGDDDDDDDDDDDSGGADPTEGDSGGSDDEPTATEADEDDAEPTEEDAEPTEDDSGEAMARGGHGDLKMLWWQAPTILNTHLAQGGKDFDASRLILEPLAEFDDAGDIVPILAAEVPSLENGGVSADGLAVTWKLRENVSWHDGEPFSAADVVFTYEWVTNEDNTATTSGSYAGIASVEAVDDFTVLITFEEPNPAWFTPFTGGNGRIIPEHIMTDFNGEASRDAPFNLAPVGTGPYVIRDFNPGDVVLYDINENYYLDGKPHFDTIEFKGGGDATSAARAAINTGDADYSWNLQVEAEILNQLADEGPGILLSSPAASVERIMINQSDPNTEVDGERSKLGVPHPFLSILEVREALVFAVDRETVANELYGPTGIPTSNWLVAPERFASPNTSYEFNVDKAKELLDAAGWVEEGGQRQKDGVKMEIVYQTSTNPIRQKTQEIVKEAFGELGVPVEIKAIDAGVFFSSDAGNPDTWAHFYADFQMYTNGPANPYPIAYADELKSIDPDVHVPQQSNSWSGDNSVRWVNEEFNAAYEQAQRELDPDIQAELFIKMNDLVVLNYVHVPLVNRATVAGHAADLTGIEPSRWAGDPWNIHDWGREGN